MGAAQVPMSFIYGESDWLDPKAGMNVCASVEKLRGKLNPADLKVRPGLCAHQHWRAVHPRGWSCCAWEPSTQLRGPWVSMPAPCLP